MARTQATQAQEWGDEVECVCVRCGLQATRRVDPSQDEEGSDVRHADECPRCGHHEVLPVGAWR